MIGRILGTVIGFLVGRFPGAAIGFAIGFAIDFIVKRWERKPNAAEKQKIEKAFFAAIFPLLGKLAKSDGRISQEEVDSAEYVFANLKLRDATRSEASALFKSGAVDEIDLDLVISEFLVACGPFKRVREMFLVYLVTMAFSDGQLHVEENKILNHVADRLGFSRFAFMRLVGMSQAQLYFERAKAERDARWQAQMDEAHRQKTELDLAYQALGVAPSDSDATIKRAHRKLMSQYHPDKVVGSGVPEEMVNIATERAQEIQAAYDLIKKQRKAK